MRPIVRYLKGIPKGLWIYWTFLLALIYAFAELADDVWYQTEIAFDARFLRLLDSVRGPVLDEVAIVLDVIGGTYFLLPLSALVVLWLWRRQRRSAVFLALAFWGATLLNGLAKVIFARARPDLFTALASVEGYAFPSGHTMGSTAFALAVVLILRRKGTRWWWLALALGLAFAFAVGASRSYLQVHFPSDVAAGWSLAAAWVLGAHAWYSRYPR